MPGHFHGNALWHSSPDKISHCSASEIMKYPPGEPGLQVRRLPVPLKISDRAPSAARGFYEENVRGNDVFLIQSISFGLLALQDRPQFVSEVVPFVKSKT